MQFLFGLLGGALAVIVMSQARPRNRKAVRPSAAHPPAQQPKPHVAAADAKSNRLSAYCRINLN